MDPFIGQIVMFAGNFAPRGWAFCDGQLLPISQNTALFSILGTTYGGDGRTTFALPDLRGRAPLHAGHGPGLSDRRLGAKGGSETVTLTATELPNHTHPLHVFNGEGDTLNGADATLAGIGTSVPPVGNFTHASPTATAASSAVGSAGGSQPHNNMQPWAAVNYIIALVGIFPSRG